MKSNKWLISIVLGTLFLTSCSNDSEDIIPLPSGKYEKGILILNQGGFQKGNASVSFVSPDLVTVENNILSGINTDKKLGDTAQSIAFYNDLAFIIVNASNKIEVVNRFTLQSIATMDKGLINPRYMSVVNGKGYVTNWGDGGNSKDDYVAVINLSDFTIINTIPVIEGPDAIQAYNNKLYVAHSGGWGFGNTLSVIDATSNTVTKSISVGDIPVGFAVKNNLIYVLCSGKPYYADAETAGKLVEINPLSDVVTKTLDFTEKQQHPSYMVSYSNALYYTLGSKVYQLDNLDMGLPTNASIDASANGLQTISSFVVFQNKIIIGDARDYNSNGDVYFFSTTGSLIKKISGVGVAPAGIYWNE